MLMKLSTSVQGFMVNGQL